MLHKKIKPIEGYLFRDLNGIIFDVKGLVHPPNNLIAFPRFLPNPFGNRTHGGVKYKKIYTLSARFEFLEQNYPQYIIYDSVFDEKLCEVPIEDIEKYYSPLERLQELRHSTEIDGLEIFALEFFKDLKTSAHTSWDKMGISGSLLVELHTPDSDIDPVIYGSENCHKVYEALKSLTQDSKSHVKKYTTEELQKLFNFRVKDTQIAFKDFEKTESRKVLQGKFKSRDYFIRFVKDWSEIEVEYGVVRYKNVGYAKIEAVIEDDSEAIFTPCTYKIKNVENLEGVHFPVEEISSFRGRFCEHARTGEAVIAQGKVERVTDDSKNREYFRLLLGNKPSDYMVLA
jgi:predicted nucleotidyltransferase